MILVLALTAQAQELPIPALSPHATATQQVGVVDVTVDYSRPGKRDRVIWGELVPWGELWRTGANAATTLELSHDATVGGTEVEAGKYSILTIPGEETWTVIVNRDATTSTGDHDEALDVARFDATPADGPAIERMTFLFDEVTDHSASLDLMWDGVKVSIPIEVPTEQMLDEAVDGYALRSARRLAQAARHYSRAGEHAKARDAADAALRMSEEWYTLWSLAEVVMAGGDARRARRYAKQAQRAGQRLEKEGGSYPEFYAKQIDAAVSDWR